MKVSSSRQSTRTFLDINLQHLQHTQASLTSSMLISKGPWDWHSGQEPGFTSWFWDWKKGPSTKLHLLQLYLTMPSWGRTPVQLLTTPLVLISWFKWSCLRRREEETRFDLLPHFYFFLVFIAFCKTVRGPLEICITCIIYCPICSCWFKRLHCAQQKMTHAAFVYTKHRKSCQVSYIFL